MTGAELLDYLKRRLAEGGLTVSDERTAELFGHLSEARDTLKGELADVAPNVLGSWVTLEVSDTTLFSLPTATGDPVRVYELRDVESKIPFDKTVNMDNDLGDYQPEGLRSWRFNQDTDTAAGVQALVVVEGAPIDADTAAADIGLPTTCHRAIGKLAAVLALTVDEESDASQAKILYENEKEKLTDRFGEMESASGEALRHSLMKSIGEQYGDMIY